MMNHASEPSATAENSGNQVVEVELEDVAKDGPAVGRYEGRVVFVRHGAPGERVRVGLDPHRDKDRWFSGDVVEVLTASPHRVPHVFDAADPLSHAPGEIVGGVEFGHLDLPYQRELKARIVSGQLSRLAGLDAADVGFEAVEPALDERADGLHWRTRSAFGVDASGRLAMRAPASHHLIPTPHFPLAVEAVDALGLGELDLTGLERVEVAVPSTGTPLVLLVPASEPVGAPRAQPKGGGRRRGRAPRTRVRPTPAGLAAVDRVAALLAEDVNVASLLQTGGAAADGAGSLRGVRGDTDVHEVVDANTFRVTGEGFWQVHRTAPATLTRAVMAAAAAEPGQSWADLYAGAGLFSLPLADAVGRQGRLVSIEGAPGTHRDAGHNLRDRPQAEAVHGRVERVLAADPSKHHGVVLDPPRAGAGQQAVAAIAASGTEKVIYVACDPAALAKDVARFAEHGYTLTGLRAFDLYPHTHHVEAVACLERA